MVTLFFLPLLSNRFLILPSFSPKNLLFVCLLLSTIYFFLKYSAWEKIRSSAKKVFHSKNCKMYNIEGVAENTAVYSITAVMNNLQWLFESLDRIKYPTQKKGFILCLKT